MAQQQVVLLFEEEDFWPPVNIGLIQASSETPRLDMILDAWHTMEEDAAAAAEPARILETADDGKRVVMPAEEEIVPRCGQATITLRNNDKIVIRDTYSGSWADGTHRIKGGSVQIN